MYLTSLSNINGTYTNSAKVVCTYQQDNSAGVALFLVKPAIWARGSVTYAKCGSRSYVSIILASFRQLFFVVFHILFDFMKMLVQMPASNLPRDK